jgi:hypothetical protein
VTPLAPPLTVAVYVVDAASSADGVSVAVEPEYDTVAATVAPPDPLSTTFELVIDDAAIGSLNVAVTFVPKSTPVAPPAGVTACTVGGFVSTGVASSTTSTQ